VLRSTVGPLKEFADDPQALGAIHASGSSGCGVLRQCDLIQISPVVCVRAEIGRNSFKAQQELAQVYARIKLGCAREVERAAADLFGALTPSICRSITKSKQEWCVLSVGTFKGFGLPSGAILVARAVSERLGISHVAVPVTGSDRERVAGKRYEELDSKTDRLSILREELSVARLPELAGKRALLIDDAIVSGAFTEVMSDLARHQEIIELHPYVLHRFEAQQDYSFEHVVNTSLIKAEPVSVMRELLSDENTALTTRLISYCLTAAPDAQHAVLEGISANSRVNLLASALVYYDGLLPMQARASFERVDRQLMSEIWKRSPFGVGATERLGSLLASRQWRNQPLSRHTLLKMLGSGTAGGHSGT
jgi:hypothetical protein